MASPFLYGGFMFGNKFLESYNQMNVSAHKNLILEPLSCVFKLCLLQYKEPGTKLSVHNNKLTFNEPSMAQGFFRTWYGHRREDLHNLYHPLRQCIAWYDRNDETYEFVYRQCIHGLRLLLETYDEHTTIHHTLVHYISILEKDDPPDSPPVNLNPIVERLRTFWTEPEIKMACDLLKLIQSDEPLAPGYTHTYRRVLEDIIESKENDVYEYISQVTTTYTS